MVHDRIGIRQLQLANIAVAIEPMTLFELGLREVRFPLVRQLVEPEFKGFGGINALGAVRLHPEKSQNVDGRNDRAT